MVLWASRQLLHRLCWPALPPHRGETAADTARRHRTHTAVPGPVVAEERAAGGGLLRDRGERRCF